MIKILKLKLQIVLHPSLFSLQEAGGSAFLFTICTNDTLTHCVLQVRPEVSHLADQVGACKSFHF